MGMSREQSLLDAIWEEPHDDAVRLVYADWLEEQGGEELLARAELIRVQIELSRIPGDDPRFDELEERERELMKKWKRRWWAAMPKGCRSGSYFNRGFPLPSLGRFSLKGLRRLDEERLRAAPLWEFGSAFGSDLDGLLEFPFLHRLYDLYLVSPLPEGWADRLAECDNLRNLSQFSLNNWPVAADELKRLLDAWSNRHFRDLSLVIDRDAEFLSTLVDHPATDRVRRLDLSYCDITARDATEFVRGRQLGGLIQLELAANPLGDAGLTKLLTWPQVPKLRSLSLAGTRLTNAGIEQLAGSPAVASLRYLHLGSNQIRVDGALALAESPHLGPLRLLSLESNPLARSTKAVEALQQRFGKRVVRF
jgi:uncharacterized protein (TIGR02996 family)